MDYKNLFVTNNKNDGAGSLRAVLEETQKIQGNYNIIFRTNELNPEPTNTFNLGYWTIPLDSPLPILERSNIRINVDDVKSVTLVPSAKGSSSSNFWRFEKDFQANGATGAFLAMGYNNIIGRPTVNVEINQFNFIRNTAKGGDSQGNGGGGLGAGAGVLLMDGVHLTLRNSIFQDLLAEGGSTSYDYSLGGRGGRGAVDTLRFSSLERSSEDGLGGSTGGKFSSFAIAPPRQFFTGIANGLGGFGGPRGTRNKKNLLNGTNGEGGLDGAFGQGGGGGGGGGGGAIYNDGWTKVIVGNGGRGGNGGNGKFGTGGGKSGVGGGGAKYTFNPSNELFGEGGGGGINGQDGEFSDGDGAALGGAIAVLGTQEWTLGQISNNSRLALDRVDFISTDVKAGRAQALGKAVFSRFKNRIFVNDSTFSANVGGSRSLLDPSKPDSNLIYGGFAPLTSTAKPTDLPVHEATSSVWNKEFADIRTPVLTNIVGIADTDIVNYERSGPGVIGVDADLSDPSNPLNALWKAVRPDKADELQSKYQAEISKSLWQAFGLKKPGEGQGTFLYALDNALIPQLGNLLGIPGGKEAQKLLTNLLKMGFSNTQLRNQLDSDLRKNAKDQAKLQEYLQSNNKAQIGTVNTALGRAPVLIKNFTIGEDNLFIPAFGEGTNGESLKFEETTQGNGWRNIRISAAQNKQSSVLTEICIIEVDPASSAALRNVGIAGSISSYLLDMTERRESGDWVLGSRVVKPYIQKDTLFRGGPAGTDVVIDRGNNRDSDDFKTTTGDADDQVYGSDGFEKIYTNAGCDIIAPGLGKDYVNAGKNADTVAYASLKQSIRAIGSSLPQNAQILSSIAISGGPNTTKILDSALDNVEIIQAFGDSVFDFSNLPDPYLNGDGFYSVRTGAGSEFKGSKFNDVVILSYDADTNDVDINGSPLLAYSETTVIDGGTGNGDTNSFYTDYSNAPEAVSLQAVGPRAFTIKNASGLTLAELRNMDVVNLEGSAQSDKFDFRPGSTRMSEAFDSSVSLARYYVHGNGGDDTFWAGSMGSEDHFYGGAGDDTFYGGSANDYFDGDDGNDRLLGADGSDYLVANKGSDLLVGGLGGDNFHIQDCPQATLADFTASDGDRLILDLIATVVFAEVSGEEELKKAIEAGEANFIYDENTRVAQWRGDDQNTYQTIGFDSPVSSTDLKLSVFGRDEILQDPDSNVDPFTRSSAALIADFFNGKERLFAGNPIDALGLAADPLLAYRWFYNGYLIAGANAASYSDEVLEKLPSGIYIRETVYTDRAGRRQTVASEPLLVEATREGSGLRVLRTGLDQRQRASLDTIQPGLQASPEVLQLRLPLADSSNLPGVQRIDLTPTGGATGYTGLVALVDPLTLLDPNQDGPAAGPLAESGQSDAGVYDFDGDGLIDTLTWQPRPDGTSSPILNTSLLTGTISTLAALPGGELRFLLNDADGTPQPLKQPALQCLSVFLLESPARMSSVMAIGLNEGETLESLSADQRRQRAINLISNQDDTPAPLESYADLYRQLWVRADQAMVLFEVPGGNASTWDGSLLSEPLKVVAPLQDPLAEPLPDSLGPTAELGSASGLRLGLMAESVPVDLNGFVARSQASAPVLDFRGLGGLTLDINVEVAREAGFESRMSFYAIEDLEGSVRDLITGELVKPGDADYARLAQSHRVEALSDLGTENLQSTSKDLLLTESRLLAPMAVVQNPESGPQTFYAFAAANSDHINHFVSFGNNVIGLEDLPGGGDFDFDDNMTSLQFRPLVF